MSEGMETGRQVREFPILFSDEMVLAILDGRKTQTRRVITPQPTLSNGRCGGRDIGRPLDRNGRFLECRSGRVGDRLWVRQAWMMGRTELGDRGIVAYRSDRNPNCHLRKWRPSIFMPRWACRVTLDVEEVKAERLQAISKEDAIAEGLARITKDGSLYKYGIPDRDGLPGSDDYGWDWCEWEKDPRMAFRKLWDSINAKRGFGWDTDPWVWKRKFRLNERP